MSIRISDDFFLITHPEMPEYKIQTLILDTNCVGMVYKWATGSKDVPTSKILPVLELIRSGRSIEITYGAMESSWAFEKAVPVTRANFDLAKLSNFRYSVLAIDTIKNSTNQQFNSWIGSSGRESIAFLPSELTRLKNFTGDEGIYRELLQSTAQEWVLFLLLLRHLKPIWNSVDFDELLEGFKNWVNEINEMRIGMSHMVTYLALHGFFGGVIHEHFFLRGKKERQKGKVFNRELVLKRQDWDEYGLARIARNLALDAVHFRERNKFQSGVIQSPYGLEVATFRGENTAIVTGDRAMNAIHCQIKAALPVKGQPNALQIELPEGSEIKKRNKEIEILEILGVRARDSRDLLMAQDLLTIAFDLMDELKFA
jgi:hypothetical protein